MCRTCALRVHCARTAFDVGTHGGRTVPIERIREDDLVLSYQLSPGGALQDPNGATPAVATLASLSRHATTYNFEVARTHTYYAGGFLVHNMKPE